MANEIQQDNDYQKPISIREAMIHIQNAEYVLPGIQRKFTWDIPRIEALFDSIMQGYPINTLMLWKITDPDIKRNYPFFEFLRNYKERFSTENPPMTRPLLEDKYAVLQAYTSDSLEHMAHMLKASDGQIMRHPRLSNNCI